MIQFDLIEFADKITPKETVQELIRQLPKLCPPVPLEPIAEAVGIKEIIYRRCDGFEGALVANKYKTEGVILVNNALQGRGGECRQRYSLGHELGHFMLPKHGHEMACQMKDIGSNRANKQIEQEANDFSSELLMPEALFSKDAYFSRTPSLHNIYQLALQYHVSVQACGNRYVKCHPTPMMLIFYEHKQMMYFSSNKQFPFYFVNKPRKGLPAPLGSLTSKTDAMAQNSFCTSKVNSRTWFNEGDNYELPTELTEEVFVQENGYSVSLLSFEKKLVRKQYHAECNSRLC